MTPMQSQLLRRMEPGVIYSTGWLAQELQLRACDIASALRGAVRKGLALRTGEHMWQITTEGLAAVRAADSDRQGSLFA